MNTTVSIMIPLDFKAGESYHFRMVMRSPAVTLFALGSLLSCQILCVNGTRTKRATASHTHDTELAAASIHDPCCDPNPTPADPGEKSDCCFLCCCSGAVLTQPLSLDHLTFAALLPVPWSVPNGDLEVDHSYACVLSGLRPPEPFLDTIVLLI